MLILKRRREQSVRIGPDVTVKVVAIQDGAVTLAIEAPESFKISREPIADGLINSVATTFSRVTSYDVALSQLDGPSGPKPE